MVMNGRGDAPPGWEPLLDDLMNDRYPRLLARAGMLAASRAEAEDVVQDALIKTFSRRRRFDSVAAAESYVRKAIVTCYVDRSTREASQRNRHERAELQAVNGTIADHAAGVAARIDLGGALAQLPPRERACLVLRFAEDLSTRATADQLGLSEGAVKRYVHDGLRTLNAAMGTDLSDTEGERSPLQDRGGVR